MEQTSHFCLRNERPCRAQEFDERDRRIARVIEPVARLRNRSFTELRDTVELTIVEQGHVIDSFNADYAYVMADTLRCMASGDCPVRLDTNQGE